MNPEKLRWREAVSGSTIGSLVGQSRGYHSLARRYANASEALLHFALATMEMS